MLADSVIMHESKAANHEQEVQKLKSETLDLQAKFSLMKDHLHVDIANLSKMKIELTSKLDLENKLSQERDAKVKQEMHRMNEYIKELEASLTEMVFIFKANKNEGNMLKLRVEELEKEVSTQNGVISDKDEEKREAIRQLCYSLEHYRNGYRELVREINKVYRGRHGHVVIAS
ncbi:hypothetical protein TSUD_303090 [Trifolium subterraneum]|uniref:NAB domain-containing protein n=1 Tax=Trifolium subterraneum TaxID=3900 RepID=A0A2Z6NKT7_TRISU|nr:hypothetical protein TSUD_303090 [Trifolium subterraneum]